MKTRRVVRGALGVTIALVTLTTSVAPAFAWTGSAGQIVIVESWNGHTEILDVEGSDSIENVRQKIYDRTGIDPADTCLIFEGTLMQDGSTLVDYRVDVGDDLNLFLLPVSAAWSITPDDHVVGNTVQNALVTSPAGTGFAVVNGALPAGVTLDEITGIVDGTFTSADPFDVTIRVTTLCGDADLTWASSGATSLPNTGVNIDSGIAAGAGALAATGIGAALLLRRRATRTER